MAMADKDADWNAFNVLHTAAGRVGALPTDTELGLDELKALDAQIDDDIQSAARRLREMAEEARAATPEETEEDSDDIGALTYQGELIYDDEDDDNF